MYSIQTQVPLASSVLAYQQELQRQTRQSGLQELYPTQKLYPVKRLDSKLDFSKLVLSLANFMIVSGQQLKERYQKEHYQLA